MSDLEIRSGGIVAVDTADLRHAAGELTSIAAGCEVVQKRLYEIGAIIAAEGAWAALPHAIVGDAIAHVRDTAADLQTLATIYEIVELHAQQAAAEAAGDQLRARSLEGRIDAMNETLSLWDRILATSRNLGWRAETHLELADQARQAAGPFGFLGMIASSVVAAMLAGVRGSGRGPVTAQDRLRGPAQPVRLRALRSSAPVTAPASLTDIIGRLPGEKEGQIRVERYTMPHGAQEFVAYVAGTRFGGDAEPFDMRSNLELYAGVRSASYDAIVQALRDAGAGRDDIVHLAGHSQGAMGVSRVALEGEFTVETVYTFGSPVQADLGDRTLQVAVRHADDPVSALAAGGFAGDSAGPGSFVAERVVDPVGHLGDVTFDVHQIDAYAETAEMLDASTDPRMDVIHERLAHLGSAVAITETLYSARRLPEAGSGGPGGGGRVGGR